MKILENITSGYKKIATGIAIVSILALMYIALMPGGSIVASAGIVGALGGSPIGGALVKIVEWPELFNTTTASDGTYTINNVPVGEYNISAWAPGYITNKSTITVVASPAVSGKDFSLSPNANMTGIIWISSYSGNAITSTMASQLPRSFDIGTEFIGQYDSRKDSAGWFSVILVSDVYGTGASLTINILYPDNGTIFNTSTIPVPANGTATIIPGDLGGLEFGMIKIKSNNPVVAEKRIVSFALGTWVSKGIMSTLMPEKSSADTEFYGQYDSRKDTAGWYTVILVSDVYGTGANLTINYQYDNGTAYSTDLTKKVPVNGTLVITPDESKLLLGKVAIRSNNPVVTEKRIVYFVPGTWDGWDLMADSMTKSSDASKELIVPIYNGNKETLGWYSVVLISDILGNGANVTIDYLHLNGTLYTTAHYNTANNNRLPANGTLTIIPGDIGLLEGKMLIHSDNAVVGEERIVNFAPGTWNVRGIMAYNLLKDTDASSNLVVPQYDSRGEWDAEVAISAVNGASTPELNYYNDSGVFVKKENYDILTNGTYAFYPGNTTLGRPEVGKIVIK